MQKIGRASAQVAGRFLFLGVSVQILLGICWGVRSFGIFPEFGDSYTWLKASETLVCDDYMGIGYPLFLMLVKGIESISSIPYTFFVYTVQILIAFYAGVVFLRACGVTGKKIFLCWGSLALLTFPCAMQSHLAVLPNSPGYSLLLLELSAVIRTLRQDAVAEDGETTAPARPLHGLFEAGIWWALSTLCVVENLYLGLVPLIVLWLIHLWQLRSRKTEKKRVGRELLLLLAMAGILFTLVPMWQTPGSYGKAENTVSAAMMRRFSWTHMREEEEYDEWPEQLRTWMTWKEMRNAGYYAGTMESGIQKTLEDRFGKAEAQKIFREYAGYHLKTYTSDNIHQIAWDCLGYAMPTVLLQLLLDGRGYDSFSGRNASKAVDYVNKVRNRAQLPALGSVSMDDIKKEKRLELWMEGCRYQDLIRWGDAATVLAKRGQERPALYKDGRVSWNEQKNASAGFKSGKHELLPFPATEMNVNKNMTQNPGW